MTKKKYDSVEDDLDFGFSFVDEAEIESPQTKEKVEDLQYRLDLLHQTITPFLDNLCKNPEKSTIHWPNRVEKIQQFKSRLNDIVEGKKDI